MNYVYIDPKYLSNAEVDIKEFFEDIEIPIEYKSFVELVAINPKHEKQIKKQFKFMSSEYAGNVKDLIDKIEELKRDNESKIELLKNQNEINMLKAKNYNDLLQKDNDLLQKDNDLLRKELEIEKMKYEILTLKKKKDIEPSDDSDEEDPFEIVAGNSSKVKKSKRRVGKNE